jgi:peptidoglycan hydrolase CwlO-like protein
MSPSKDRRLDFIAMAIQGKQMGFEKVIKMIDEMVATLKTEQTDDDNKKEYCAKHFDEADDKKKSLEHSVADLDTSIADTKEGIATLESEIEALEASIKAR